MVSALRLVFGSVAVRGEARGVRGVPGSQEALLGGSGLCGFPIAGSNWNIQWQEKGCLLYQ